jgi:hypothetical protein
VTFLWFIGSYAVRSSHVRRYFAGHKDASKKLVNTAKAAALT